MRTIKKFKGIFGVLLAASIAVCLALCLAPAESAAADGMYAFEISSFDAVYDVHADRTIDVEERVTIDYTGTRNTGFIRDLPVNDGDRVYGIDVKQFDGRETDVDYTVEIEDELIMIDIGDHSVKHGEYTYIIRYEYAVTSPKNQNVLPLNVVGFGSQAPINRASVTLHLPEGFDRAGTHLYVGDTSMPSDELMDISGNTIYAELTGLRAFEGITVDIAFAEGVLSTRFDIVPYIMAIVGCVLLAVLTIFKSLVFRKKSIAPVVTFEPPRGMDPVEISKLIDNKVESADITTLIFYWAAKGYIKIDMSDESDPLLIRINRTLPEGFPKHQNLMYNALFYNRDMVKMSDLEGNFYTNIERVRRAVNEKYTGLYTKTSVCASLAFTLLGGLLMALAPVVTGLVSISSALFYYPAFLAIVPAFIIYGITETYAYSVHKLNGGTKALMMTGIALLCALFTAVYVWLIPSAIIETVPKILVCAAAYILTMLSVTLITRTNEYNAMLSEIIGFRNFILYAEKDRLELMLKDDPEFYYKILPYAQVMGVSDIWEDKFEALTVKPPQWLTDPAGTYVSFALVNRAVRMSSSQLTARMIARPASPSLRSYSGGSRGGGSFGGRGGGGHGGGGFRGR